MPAINFRLVDRRTIAFFVILALAALLFAVLLWFGFAPMFNGLWHSVHGVLASGTDSLSHHP